MKTGPPDEKRDAPNGSGKNVIPVLAKALDLLDCFDSEEQPANLAHIVKRTGISQTTAYRILCTLVSRGYLQRTGTQYRLNRLRRRPVIGFANCSRQIALAVDIQASVEGAARSMGVNLLIWDNDRNVEIALQNAREMVKQKVDIAIEFQLYEQIAPIILDIFSRAGIPLIAVINPIYGTQYFGVDNYRAGLSAGVALAEYAKRHWQSPPSSVVLLESPRAGRMVQSRLVGAMQALEDGLGPLGGIPIQHVDGGGERELSRIAMTDYLRGQSSKRVMIIAINDESAIGAAEATQRLRARGEIAIVSYGGSAEILELIDTQATPCVGTVSFHAENYGPALINFALPSSQDRPAGPSYYIPHEYLDKESLAGKSQSVSVLGRARVQM
ncbi:MAG: substrate-binding domain-containing protein [Candidatus Acidiferrales bacterium]